MASSPRDRDAAGSHGRFAAPGQRGAPSGPGARPINPKHGRRAGGLLPRGVLHAERTCAWARRCRRSSSSACRTTWGTKEGVERKALFITALLPVILEVNQRVMAEREQLLYLRDKVAAAPLRVTPIERIWLENLADRYESSVDRLDELVRRVDIVPPSMAIAQGGVESGWGTSFAARNGNALYGQIQTGGRHSVSVPWKPGAGMPQPFTDVGEATDAYITNLNTHPAYASFRAERAAMRERGEHPEGYRLIGTLLRYSERGQAYVQFVRQIMRENELGDFDKSRLSSF